MELSDKKLNTCQKGIWQKIFSLAVYGVCIVAVTYAIAFLIKNDILKALTAIQKQTYNSKIMTFRTAKKVTVYAPECMDWTLDGEREPGHEQVTVENLHLAIKLRK